MFFFSPVHSLNNGCAVAAAARATTIYYFTCYITTTASNAYSCPCNVMMKSTGADTMIIVRATPLSCVPSISVSLCSMLHGGRCFFRLQLMHIPPHIHLVFCVFSPSHIPSFLAYCMLLCSVRAWIFVQMGQSSENVARKGKFMP